MKEEKIIKEIMISYDWEEVLNYIVFSNNINPLDIDLIKLTDSFMIYLQKLKDFDFKIPGRFILIAAILLRMKMELLLEKEEKEISQKVEEAPKINLDVVNTLTSPISRKPTRTISLHELISSLEKTISFKERKYKKKFFKHELDHIFYRGFDVIMAKALNSSRISDHNPLLVTFKNTVC